MNWWFSDDILMAVNRFLELMWQMLWSTNSVLLYYIVWDLFDYTACNTFCLRQVLFMIGLCRHCSTSYVSPFIVTIRSVIFAILYSNCSHFDQLLLYFTDTVRMGVQVFSVTGFGLITLYPVSFLYRLFWQLNKFGTAKCKGKWI